MAVVHYNHPVRQIPQPRGSHKCWAACVAMVRHTHGAAATVVDAVVAEMRGHGVAVNTDDTLPEGSVAPLARRLHMRHWPERPEQRVYPLPPGLLATVLRHGPAIAFGERRPEDAGDDPFHVVVLDKLNGDTDPQRSLHLLVHGIDPLIPAGGGGFELNVSAFQVHIHVNHLIYRAR